MKSLFVAIAAGAALLTSVAVAERRPDAASADMPIDFTVRAADAGQLDFRLTAGARTNMSRRIPRDGLTGFSPDALTRSGPVRFAVIRDAGRLECAGDVAAQVARGQCRFSPDAGFARFLADQGIGSPRFDQSFDMAIVGVSRALVEALARADFPRATIGQLVELAAVGVTPAYIADLDRHDYRPATLDNLVAFRALGIDGAFAGDMTRAGIGRLTADGLIQLKAVGVTPDYVASLAAAGVPIHDADDIVQLRALNVTGDYVRELASAGLAPLPAEKLVEMKAVGVTPDDIARARRAGIALKPDALVQMRALGRY